MNNSTKTNQEIVNEMTLEEYAALSLEEKFALGGLSVLLGNREETSNDQED